MQGIVLDYIWVLPRSNSDHIHSYTALLWEPFRFSHLGHVKKSLLQVISPGLAFCSLEHVLSMVQKAEWSVSGVCVSKDDEILFCVTAVKCLFCCCPLWYSIFSWCFSPLETQYTEYKKSDLGWSDQLAGMMLIERCCHWLLVFIFGSELATFYFAHIVSHYCTTGIILITYRFYIKN